MAILDFPSSPTNGQIYPSPAVQGQPQYTYDGEKWISGTSQGAIYVSDSPPAAPVGSLWFESDTGVLYVRYNDGDSTQWVAIPGGPADAVRYGAQTLTSAQRSQARANIDVTKKNYIINGAMQVSQENGAANGTPFGGAYYPVDMFVVTNLLSAGTINTAQIASVTPGGSPNRIRITTTAADTSIAAGEILVIQSNVEGLRSADLCLGTATAKTVTLQFGVKIGVAGTYSVAFANYAQDRIYVAEYVITAGQINTDQVVSLTIPGDVTGTWVKDNTNGLRLTWGLSVGSTYQRAAGSWGTGGPFFASPNQVNFAGTIGVNFELFDVSLTEGATAPPFAVPDYASELQLCRRYYEVSAAFGTFFCGNIVATVPYFAYAKFAVEKRAAPTVALVSQLINGFPAVSGTAAIDVQGFYEQRSANATGNGGIFTSSYKANARI